LTFSAGRSGFKVRLSKSGEQVAKVANLTRMDYAAICNRIEQTKVFLRVRYLSVSPFELTSSPRFAIKKESRDRPQLPDRKIK